MTPWTDESPIKKQWDINDFENITSTGHKQCFSLGKWFYHRITSVNIKQDSDAVFWRCSKAGRAKESGVDFIRGFNSDRPSEVMYMYT